MILKLFRRTPPEGTIACLYGTIVAQARLPAFYQIYGVPDTVSGRLEMIMPGGRGGAHPRAWPRAV